MKTTLKLSMLALASIIVLDSCKKGENDPFLSFKSRKGRVEGEWKLSSSEATTVDAGTTSTDKFDGANMSSIVGSGTPTVTTYEETMTMGKDGSYKMTSKQVYTKTVGTIVTTVTWDETASGTWNFTSKVGEAKNKDHITITTNTWSTNETTIITGMPVLTDPESGSYTGDLAPTAVYYLDELRGKKMVITKVGTATQNGPDSYTEIKTFEQSK